MTPETYDLVLSVWLRALLFTLAVEVPIFTLMVRGHAPPWRAALAGAAGTCVTHPALWFLWSQVISDYTLYIASGELLVATAETFTFFALVRHEVTLKMALAASFVANAASYGAGLLFT